MDTIKLGLKSCLILYWEKSNTIHLHGKVFSQTILIVYVQIEKTVEIDETSRFIEDLEMLRSSNPEQLAISVDENSPDHGSLDALGSFNFGSSNPLEQLGLYMKRDEHEEDDGELKPPSIVPSGMDVDVEEGEID